MIFRLMVKIKRIISKAYDLTKRIVKSLSNLVTHQVGLFLEFKPLPKLREMPLETIIHYPVIRKTDDSNGHKMFIQKVLRDHNFGEKYLLLPHYGNFRVILLRIGKIFRRYGIILYSHNFTKYSLDEKSHNLSAMFFSRRAYKVLKGIIFGKHTKTSVFSSKETRIQINNRCILLISYGINKNSKEQSTTPSLIKLIINEIRNVYPDRKIEEILISSPLVSDAIIENLLNLLGKNVEIKILVDYEQSGNIDDSTRKNIEKYGELKAIEKLYHRFIIIGDLVFILSSNLTIRGTIQKDSLALVIRDQEILSKFKEHFNNLWNSMAKDLKPPERGKSQKESRTSPNNQIPSFVRPGAVKQISAKPRETQEKRNISTKVFCRGKKVYPRFIKIDLIMHGETIIETSQQTKTYCYILTKEDRIGLKLRLSPLNKNKMVEKVEIHTPNSKLETVNLQDTFEKTLEFDTSNSKPNIKVNLFTDEKEIVYLINVGILKINIKPDKNRYSPREKIVIELTNRLKDRGYKIVLEDFRKRFLYKFDVPKDQNSCEISLPDNVRGKIILCVEDDKGNKYLPGIELNISYIGDIMYIGRKSIRFYVNKVLECLQYYEKITIKARGSFISKAADVAEIVCRKRDIRKEPSIKTEEIVTSDGRSKPISAIEITLLKSQQ